MVLRTVYFPVEMDEQLKLLAFNKSTSKGDLIRRAVAKLFAEDSEAAGVDTGEVAADGTKCAAEASAPKKDDGEAEVAAQ